MQVAMLVAMHLLYAAIGFLDFPNINGTSTSHFAEQSWTQTFQRNVRASLHLLLGFGL